MNNKYRTKKGGVRTRMAPSPTGMLHIGGLRTALYNYLFAKQNGGEFFLRIEDTDRQRYVEGAAEKVEAMLKWAGLEWDKSPKYEVGGMKYKGIWIQSERVEIYKKHAEQLAQDGKAYYCFCTQERLAKMREEQQAKKLPPKYDGTCRGLNKEEAAKKLKGNELYVIRHKVPESKMVEFNDIVYGKVRVNSSELDDQVLLKSDGYPTYHLAVVVDDHEMGITHVLRGEEWLPSTPKHILLYEAFGWEPPVYCHLPNILGENKRKLSKREGDVSVEEFKNKGYLPEALINYISLLGWNPGTEQEIFSLEELVEQFDIQKIHKAGAVFDIKKLDNINGQYIRQLSVKQLSVLCEPYLKDKIEKYGKDYVVKVVAVEQERLKQLSDIKENAKLFFTDKLEYDATLLIWKKGDKTIIIDNLTIILQKLETIKQWNKIHLEKEIMQFIQDQKLSNGEVLWPLRVALSGQQNSPGPFEIMDVLGQEESVKRVVNAITKLS